MPYKGISLRILLRESLTKVYSLRIYQYKAYSLRKMITKNKYPHNQGFLKEFPYPWWLPQGNPFRRGIPFAFLSILCKSLHMSSLYTPYNPLCFLSMAFILCPLVFPEFARQTWNVWTGSNLTEWGGGSPPSAPAGLEHQFHWSCRLGWL